MRGGGPGEDLRTLEDHQAQKEEMIAKDINNNIEKHIRWNEGYVDKTAAPLTPRSESPLLDPSQDFREAIPAYLPTPPASISDEDNQDVEMRDADVKEEPRAATPFRYASPADDGRSMPSFRRRIGRGGRLMIDRRIPIRTRDQGEFSNPRFEFDNSDEDDLSDDPNGGDSPESFHLMQYRAHLFGRVKDSEAAQAQAQAARRAAQAEAVESNQQITSA